MKLKRFLFAGFVLILVMLACGLPGADSQVVLPSPTVEVEAPVTIIVVVEHTATSVVTETPEATSTPTIPPEITLTKNSNCRLGPSGFYNIVDQISSGNTFDVIGRSEDNTWWQIVNATQRECWIFYENAEANNANFEAIPVKDGAPLPGAPIQFYVTQQQCQPGAQKFIVTLSWQAGADNQGLRLYRDGNRIAELKLSRVNYQDINAPLGKNVTYELEAYNENGVSAKVLQVVPACK